MGTGAWDIHLNSSDFFDNADKVICTNKLSGDYISLQSVSAKSGLKPTIFLFSLHR